MLPRLFFLFFLGILALIFQIGLIATFLPPFSSINIILIILFFLFYFNCSRGFFFFSILWMGFLIELFSASFFGLTLLTLLLTFFLVIICSSIFLTSRTVAVLIATSFLVFIFYNLIFVFLNFLVSLKFDVGSTYYFLEYLKSGVIGALVNTPLILILNVVIKRSSRFFKGFFIFN